MQWKETSIFSIAIISLTIFEGSRTFSYSKPLVEVVVMLSLGAHTWKVTAERYGARGDVEDQIATAATPQRMKVQPETLHHRLMTW
jgi:hypothetical protein